MFRKQALEHYRSDFSETEIPFFISNTKITILFSCIALGLACFYMLLLYPTTLYVPIDGYINVDKHITVTTSNLSTFHDKIKDNKTINYTLYIQNNEIASGAIEKIEKIEAEIVFHLILNKGDHKLIKKHQNALCNLNLMSNQKLISFIL